MLQKYTSVVVCICLALVSGCGAAPDLSEASRKLKAGDSKQRVIELCGTPHRKSIVQDVEKWYYEAPTTLKHGAEGRLIIEVQFKNEKMVVLSRGRVPLSWPSPSSNSSATPSSEQ